MEQLEEIVIHLTEDQILDLFYASGCKEPLKNLKISTKGWTTIRCSEHEDSEDHKQGKRASLNINVQTGGFKCMSCGYSGNLLTIAKRIVGDNTKDALEFLAEEAGITINENKPKRKPLERPKKPEPKPIEYLIFDKARKFTNVDIEKWLPKFSEMNEVQQYKFILTSIYRASLKTDQSKKQSYYEGRGILNSNINYIGFIPKDDKSFWKPIEEMYGLEKLIHFGFYQPVDANWHPMSWKFGAGDVCFIPSFDLYSDTLTGAMLRPLIKPANGQKEFSLNQPRLVSPIPFMLTPDILMSNNPIWITEGSVDGLSLGEDKASAPIPGVNGLPDELLGLFIGKVVILALDQDDAGQKAAIGYTDPQGTWHDGLKQRLLKAGAKNVLIAKWDIEHGKDINDLRQNGHLDKITISV